MSYLLLEKPSRRPSSVAPANLHPKRQSRSIVFRRGGSDTSLYVHNGLQQNRWSPDRRAEVSKVSSVDALGVGKTFHTEETAFLFSRHGSTADLNRVGKLNASQLITLRVHSPDYAGLQIAGGFRQFRV